MHSFNKAAIDLPNPLAHALGENEAIQESVEQSAAELLVVNAVLSHEIPDEAKTGEVAQALQRTEELEDRIQASADDLARVNQVLKDEISARSDLERQLAVVQAELGQAEARLHSQPVVYSPARSISGS